jgi:RAD51-like protein 2
MRPFRTYQHPRQKLCPRVRFSFNFALVVLRSHHSLIDLNIPLPESQALFASTSTSKLPLTQSVASLTTTTHKFSTHCPPVDRLLKGGLTRGHILEVSGPPGTMKEAIAVGVVRAFVERMEHVLFVGEYF